MSVPPLRHAPTRCTGFGGKGVTVVDRDAIEVGREHARGDQPCDAAADDNGVVAVESAREAVGRS